VSNGYLSDDEIKRVKPIKVTPNSSGFESQRAVILIKANGQASGTYLWNSVTANSNSPGNQAVIERAITEEMKVLEFLGLPCDYVSAARSLLIDSGWYELTESGLAVPSTTRSHRRDDTILED
jgi:hypothetical protein